jgi:hypothetical protein
MSDWMNGFNHFAALAIAITIGFGASLRMFRETVALQRQFWHVPRRFPGNGEIAAG